jgi:hypothetical protein
MFHKAITYKSGTGRNRGLGSRQAVSKTNKNNFDVRNDLAFIFLAPCLYFSFSAHKQCILSQKHTTALLHMIGFVLYSRHHLSLKSRPQGGRMFYRDSDVVCMYADFAISFMESDQRCPYYLLTPTPEANTTILSYLQRQRLKNLQRHK